MGGTKPITTPGGDMRDLTISEGVKAHMSESTSRDDWNRRCDEVKAANGDYPSFWYSSIILSGLCDQVMGAGSSQISTQLL